VYPKDLVLEKQEEKIEVSEEIVVDDVVVKRPLFVDVDIEKPLPPSTEPTPAPVSEEDKDHAP